MMGHMGYSNFKKLIKNSTGLKLKGHVNTYSTYICCLKSKLRKRPFAERKCAERKGEIFYLDLVPIIKPEGYNQKYRYIFMTNDYTTGIEIKFIQSKNDILNHVKELQVRRKVQGKSFIIYIFSDRDSVFMSQDFEK